MNTTRAPNELGGALSLSAAEPVARVEAYPQGTETALRALIEAYDFAQQLCRDRWEFALEIACLEKMGLTRSGIRWMVCQGLVEHAREVHPVKGHVRTFRSIGRLTFHARTCFVLTDRGVAFARPCVAAAASKSDQPIVASGTQRETNAHTDADSNSDAHSNSDGENPKPFWDPIRQELRWSEQVIKRFKVPAPNQELILAVFQEDGWPLRIDDPLPPHPEIDPKRRLHDTINALNRKQISPLLRFLGDGKGRGVLWQAAATTTGVGNDSDGEFHP